MGCYVGDFSEGCLVHGSTSLRSQGTAFSPWSCLSSHWWKKKKKRNNQHPNVCPWAPYLWKGGMTFQRQIWQSASLGDEDVCSLLVTQTGKPQCENILARNFMGSLVLPDFCCQQWWMGATTSIQGCDSPLIETFRQECSWCSLKFDHYWLLQCDLVEILLVQELMKTFLVWFDIFSL